MKTAIYARVSTGNGNQHPESQLREVREYCKRRSWKIAREYVDVGISGAKEKPISGALTLLSSGNLIDSPDRYRIFCVPWKHLNRLGSNSSLSQKRWTLRRPQEKCASRSWVLWLNLSGI